MSMATAHTVLVDLCRGALGSLNAAATVTNIHPWALSPARLPCSIGGDDLQRLQALVSGESAMCDVILTFRLQDLDDLGVLAIEQRDAVAGLFDTSGTSLVVVPAHVHIKAETSFATGEGVSLERPGRHLLCVRFHGQLD